MSELRVYWRPRNDEHIMTPNTTFEPLRTAYNPKKHSNLKGMGHNSIHTISTQAFHSPITLSR